MNTNYKSDTLPFEKLRKCIKLPSFQRNVVWTSEKKESFIDSIINGLPFGSLLLYKENPDEYLLVDGLQRYTTLEDFNKNPYKYINFEKECQSYVNDLIKQIDNLTTSQSEFKKLIINSIKQNFRFNFEASDINAIKSEIPVLDNTSCFSILLTLFTRLKDKFNISSLEIPLICYSGDYDELPTIFERMNANGTQLSKYEIYAAKWSTIKFSYHDTTILQLVDEKYGDMMEKTGVDILNYSEGQIIREQEINLFEFCFAFGKLLQKDFPNIFGNNNFSTSDVTSIGFTLLSCVLCGSTKNINVLSKFFDTMDNNKTQRLKILKDKILDCVKTIDKTLSNYTTSLDGRTNISKYIESQTICIIVTLFRIRYTLNSSTFEITENPNTRKLCAKFEKNMPKRYLYDTLFGYWAGSGDSKIAEELSKEIAENRYLNPVPISSWQTQLYDWMVEQTQKPMKKMLFENKLFLNFLTKLNISNTKYFNSGKKFEFEYIISKDKFQKKFKDKNGMSAIGNLCILPQSEIRSKQELTLYEVLDNRTLVYDVKEETLSDFLYPERSELSFVSSDESFTYDNYSLFLKERHQYLINTFISLIDN